MQRFEFPTLNDFNRQVRTHFDSTIESFKKEKGQIASKFSAAGRYHSSARLLAMVELVNSELRAGVAMILGELRRCLNEPHLDKESIRETAFNEARQLLQELRKNADLAGGRHIQSASADQAITDRLNKAESDLDLWLRQFDIGWDQPPSPEPLPPSA